MDDQLQLLPNEIWYHIFSFNRHMILEERKLRRTQMQAVLTNLKECTGGLFHICNYRDYTSQGPWRYFSWHPRTYESIKAQPSIDFCWTFEDCRRLKPEEELRWDTRRGEWFYEL